MSILNPELYHEKSHCSQELGANWPNGVRAICTTLSARLTVTAQGEIDIIEGVNNKIPNQSTLHTSAGRYSNSGIDVLLHILPQVVECHRLGR